MQVVGGIELIQVERMLVRMIVRTVAYVRGEKEGQGKGGRRTVIEEEGSWRKKRHPAGESERKREGLQSEEGTREKAK